MEPPVSRKSRLWPSRAVEKPSGSVSSAMASMAAMASPRETPSAGSAETVAAVKRLKRYSWGGAADSVSRTRFESGIGSPAALRTKMPWMALGVSRASRSSWPMISYCSPSRLK